MRIEIEIPKEFEGDYDADRFRDFFARAMIDIETMQGMCGRYEIETAEMLQKAFEKSKVAYDVEAVVEELEKQAYTTTDTVCGGRFEAIRLSSSISIVRNGGKE